MNELRSTVVENCPYVALANFVSITIALDDCPENNEMWWLNRHDGIIISKLTNSKMHRSTAQFMYVDRATEIAIDINNIRQNIYDMLEIRIYHKSPVYIFIERPPKPNYSSCTI